jgi:hypothetical protein
VALGLREFDLDNRLIPVLTRNQFKKLASVTLKGDPETVLGKRDLRPCSSVY